MRREEIGPVRRLAARLVLAIAMIAGVLAVGAGPAMAQDPTETDASVRVVHASPDAPAVDVIVDGAVEAEGLMFGEATDYLPVSPGEHQLQLTPEGSGPDSAVIDTTIDVEGGKSYIVAATGLLNEIEPETYEVLLEDLDDPAQSRVDLINLSPDAGNVDVFVTGGDELFSDVEFREASEHVDLDAGSYDLEVRENDSDNVLISAPGVRIEEGRSYDLILIGLVSEQSLALFPLASTVDAPCSDVLAVGTEEDACVRVAHTSPDGPAIDVYVNDSLVVENLAYGAATEFTALPAGDDRNVKIVPTGSPIDDAVVDSGVDLDAGVAYQILVTGMVDDIDTMTEEVDLTSVPEGQARMRVIHVAPDGEGVDIVVTDGPTLFEGVDFRDVTDYEVLDAGTYDIQFRQGDEVALRVQDLTLEANTVYDVLVIGRAEDGTLEIIALTAPAEPSEGGVASPEAATPSPLAEETPEAIATSEA